MQRYPLSLFLLSFFFPFLFFPFLFFSSIGLSSFDKVKIFRPLKSGSMLDSYRERIDFTTIALKSTGSKFLEGIPPPSLLPLSPPPFSLPPSLSPRLPSPSLPPSLSPPSSSSLVLFIFSFYFIEFFYLNGY